MSGTFSAPSGIERRHPAHGAAARAARVTNDKTRRTFAAESLGMQVLDPRWPNPLALACGTAVRLYVEALRRRRPRGLGRCGGRRRVARPAFVARPRARPRLPAADVH